MVQQRETPDRGRWTAGFWVVGRQRSTAPTMATQTAMMMEMAILMVLVLVEAAAFSQDVEVPRWMSKRIQRVRPHCAASSASGVRLVVQGGDLITDAQETESPCVALPAHGSHASVGSADAMGDARMPRD